MKFKLKDNIIIKMKWNQLNKILRPSGMFIHYSFVKIQKVYKPCTIGLTENKIKIHFDSVSSRETIEQEIGYLKKSLVAIFLNQHVINYKIHRAKEFLFSRSRIMKTMLIAGILSFVYYLININTGDALSIYIQKSAFLQSVMFFFTIGGFIGLFMPFSFQKSIEQKDVESIVSDQKNRDEEDKRIREMATF